MRFAKGHGTENDFVVLPDLDDRLELTPELVRALCDRRTGIGADGVLRVVRGRVGTDAAWCMDYRNADGSVAQMCGNGIRVLARYLVSQGLAPVGRQCLATPGGVRPVDVPAFGDVTVDMGAPSVLDFETTVAGRPATAVGMGNPHVVVVVPTLDGLDLSRPPLVQPGLPEGQNVEFVVRRGPRALAVRVYERGVGETRSCGTGACAAVVATVLAEGEGRGKPWAVELPGGDLTVTWTVAGSVLLAGPAVLVAEGEWLAPPSR